MDMTDKNTAALAEETGWLIYKAGRGWYRPNAQGYTYSPAKAGRYSKADALSYSHPNGHHGPRDGISIHHESEVPGAILAKHLPDQVGVDTCEAPEVAAMRYIEQLRENYGTVTFLPDNEEAETRDTQTAIDCCGEWTNWQDQRFYGETPIQCLARAVGILNKWKDMNNVG